MTQISSAPWAFSRSHAATMVPGGVDHVVDQDAVAALDVTDDVARLGDVGRAARAGLVHEREVAAQVLGVALGDLDAPGVGRDHDQFVGVGVGLEVLLEHRRRDQVVDRDVEEALDLAGVEVDREDPVGARRSGACRRSSLAVMGSRPADLRSWRA